MADVDSMRSRPEHPQKLGEHVRSGMRLTLGVEKMATVPGGACPDIRQSGMNRETALTAVEGRNLRIDPRIIKY